MRGKSAVTELCPNPIRIEGARVLSSMLVLDSCLCSSDEAIHWFVSVQLNLYMLIFLYCRGLETLELQQIFGFVVNKPSNVNLIWLEVPIKRPHWFAVRKINDNYYNLDSKLSSPQCIGNEEKVVKFLTDMLSLPAVQLFIIVEKSVAENSLWKRL